jgi:hypothetical protein
VRRTTTKPAFTRRLRALGLGGAVAALALCPSPARADESPAPPRHLAPYGLDWIAYVTPDDLPPTRSAVCLVDSGVAITPDTPPDNPTGPILERLATDGGSGEPQGDAPAHLHGTRMAMAAIAPQNGWGTIGIASWVPVVAVRAMGRSDTRFGFDAYQRGIAKCLERHARHPLAAISLSLGSACQASEAEQAQLDDYVGAAHAREISVVASAGNQAGATIDSPASTPGVLAVAAGDELGALCDYGSYDERVAVLGPACPVETADPLTGTPLTDRGGGSSTAALATSVALASLRTLRPDATRQDVESWVVNGSRPVAGRRVLDAERAAREGGLGDVVGRARAGMTAPAATPASDTPSGDSGTLAVSTPHAQPGAPARARLREPSHVRARWRRGRVTVQVGDRPAGAHLEVVAERLRGFRVVRRTAREAAADRLTLRIRRPPSRLLVRYRPGRELSPRASGRAILYRARDNRYR